MKFIKLALVFMQIVYTASLLDISARRVRTYTLAKTISFEEALGEMDEAKTGKELRMCLNEAKEHLEVLERYGQSTQVLDMKLKSSVEAVLSKLLKTYEAVPETQKSAIKSASRAIVEIQNAHNSEDTVLKEQKSAALQMIRKQRITIAYAELSLKDLEYVLASDRYISEQAYTKLKTIRNKIAVLNRMDKAVLRRLETLMEP